MADDKGSDLDIFEGLGKKASGASPSNAPPPNAPPPPPRNGGPPPPPPGSKVDASIMKRTLVGMSPPMNLPPGPPNAPPRSPPPPPGRGSLPNVSPPPQKMPQFGAPSSGQMRPAASAAAAPPPPPPPGAPPPVPQAQATPQAPDMGGLDMDWDDEDEATHVFDKATGEEPAAARPDKIRPAAGTDYQPQPPPTTPSVNERAAKQNGANLLAPPPPPPPPAPPPPPGNVPPAAGSVGTAFARGSNTSSTAQGPAFAPPPPQQASGPGGTAPMMMPGAPRGPNGVAAPPAGAVAMTDAAIAQIASRAMEQTAVTRPSSSKGLVAFLAVALVVVAAAAAAFFLIPRTGRLLVNVVDDKDGLVDHVEVFVDGKKECDTAPCIVQQATAGAHAIKLVSPGFEAAARTIVVERGKDATVDFKLVPSTPAAAPKGTGVKIAGTQPGVKLSIDGKEIGPLPQEVKDLAPGEHKIKLVGSERYAPWEKTVTVQKDDVQDLGAPLLKVLKGKITVSLGTPGAKVFLVSGGDRRELPTLPVSIDPVDTTRTWQLEATKSGMADYKEALNFDDGQAEKTISVTLQPKDGAGAGATGTASPTPVNPTTPTPTPTPAPPVAHAPAPPAAPAGGEAFLNINSLPAASVVLDGRPLGNTPKLHVSVSAGSHKIIFVNSEQGLRKEINVTVGAGETKPAFAKLRD